jgi:hypothetical protein
MPRKSLPWSLLHRSIKARDSFLSQRLDGRGVARDRGELSDDESYLPGDRVRS